MARIQQSIEIHLPPSVVYACVSRFEQYPRFMEAVDEIRKIDTTHYRWCAKIASGNSEWDAEITEQVPAKIVAWRNSGSQVRSCRIELQPVGADATRICVTAEGEVSDKGEKEMAQRLQLDLLRLKKFLECEEAGGRSVTAGTPGLEENRHASATVAEYVPGSEGVDGNEDPGVAVGTVVPGEVPAGALTGPDTGQAAPSTAEAADSPRRQTGTQSPAMLSVGINVAEEQSFDQQSEQARRVGRMPQKQAAEALAQSMHDAQQPKQANDNAAPSPAQPDAVRSSAAARRQDLPWLPGFLHAWEEPIKLMKRMSEELDRMFDTFVGRPANGSPESSPAAASRNVWSPPLDIAQQEGRLVISADLPGVKAQDINVELTSDQLIIEGERHEESGSLSLHDGGGRSERCYGRFYRIVALPEQVEPEAASASLRNGILEVSAPIRHARRQSRRLDIRSS